MGLKQGDLQSAWENGLLPVELHSTNGRYHLDSDGHFLIFIFSSSYLPWSQSGCQVWTWLHCGAVASGWGMWLSNGACLPGVSCASQAETMFYPSEVFLHLC